MGPYSGFDYNLGLCRLQRRLQHMYYGQPTQPFARVDFIPQSGTWDLASGEHQPCSRRDGNFYERFCKVW
jgi:hypothetical protein